MAASMIGDDVVKATPEIRAVLDALAKLPEFETRGLPGENGFRGWTETEWDQFQGGCYYSTEDGHSIKVVYGTERLALLGQARLTYLGVASRLEAPDGVKKSYFHVLLFDARDLLGKDLSR
jgi:hypothetical protein